MSDEIFPRHYEAWRKCITEKCNIPLTRDFIEARIQVLSDQNSKEHQVFLEKYGPNWTKRVLGYFQQAMHDLSVL
jgi:hypothetical protein